MLASSPVMAYWFASSVVMALTAANVFLQRIELLWLCPFTFYVSLRLIGCGSLCARRSHAASGSSDGARYLETPHEEDYDRLDDSQDDDDDDDNDDAENPDLLLDDSDTLLEDVGSALADDYDPQPPYGGGGGNDSDSDKDSGGSMPSLLHVENFRVPPTLLLPSPPPIAAYAPSVLRTRSDAVTEDYFFDLEVGDEPLSPIFESKTHGFRLDDPTYEAKAPAGTTLDKARARAKTRNLKRKRSHAQPLEPANTHTYGTFSTPAPAVG